MRILESSLSSSSTVEYQVSIHPKGSSTTHSSTYFVTSHGKFCKEKKLFLLKQHPTPTIHLVCRRKLCTGLYSPQVQLYSSLISMIGPDAPHFFSAMHYCSNFISPKGNHLLLVKYREQWRAQDGLWEWE